MLSYFGQVLRDPDGYQWVLEEKLPVGSPRYDPYPLKLVAKNIATLAPLAKVASSKGWVPEYSYDPFVEEPALFRIFAALEQTEAAILGFAHQYGDIGTLDQTGWVEGTYFREWKKAIRQIAKLTEKADGFIARRLSGKAKKDEIFDAQDFVNAELANLRLPLKAAAYEDGHLSIQCVATGLVEVMTLQIMSAVASSKRYRECEFCGKPFELAPEHNRADRVFCTDNCRVKAYQRRRKQAIELRDAGRPLREIAKKTQTPLATVKKWVESTETKEK